MQNFYKNREQSALIFTRLQQLLPASISIKL